MPRSAPISNRPPFWTGVTADPGLTCPEIGSSALVQVLLFCHSVKMLNIIEQLVIRAGYHYARLDGSTKTQDRQAMCDAFNHSSSLFLFLISTTAGGLGLNLTSANKWVLVSCPSYRTVSMVLLPGTWYVCSEP